MAQLVKQDHFQDGLGFLQQVFCQDDIADGQSIGSSPDVYSSPGSPGDARVCRDQYGHIIHYVVDYHAPGAGRFPIRIPFGVKRYRFPLS